MNDRACEECDGYSDESDRRSKESIGYIDLNDRSPDLIAGLPEG